MMWLSIPFANNAHLAKLQTERYDAIPFFSLALNYVESCKDEREKYTRQVSLAFGMQKRGDKNLIVQFGPAKTLIFIFERLFNSINRSCTPQELLAYSYFLSFLFLYYNLTIQIRRTWKQFRNVFTFLRLRFLSMKPCQEWRGRWRQMDRGSRHFDRKTYAIVSS